MIIDDDDFEDETTEVKKIKTKEVVCKCNSRLKPDKSLNY